MTLIWISGFPKNYLSALHHAKLLQIANRLANFSVEGAFDIVEGVFDMVQNIAYKWSKVLETSGYLSYDVRTKRISMKEIEDKYPEVRFLSILDHFYEIFCTVSKGCSTLSKGPSTPKLAKRFAICSI